MKHYLESSEYIDWQSPQVHQKALQLSQDCTSQRDVAEACYLFVRDEVKHSYDYKLNPITIKASEVLEQKTGYCYSKSHLLAALLRANQIPAALCYQRLTFQDDRPPFCIHGLNAMFLENIGWYRVDARGNKDGVSAEFNPPIERLAFETKLTGEFSYEKLYCEPVAEVISVLTRYSHYQDVADHLPDRID